MIESMKVINETCRHAYLTADVRKRECYCKNCPLDTGDECNDSFYPSIVSIIQNYKFKGYKLPKEKLDELADRG